MLQDPSSGSVAKGGGAGGSVGKKAAKRADKVAKQKGVKGDATGEECVGKGEGHANGSATTAATGGAGGAGGGGSGGTGGPDEVCGEEAEAEEEEEWGEDASEQAQLERMNQLSDATKALMMNDELEKSSRQRLRTLRNFLKAGHTSHPPGPSFPPLPLPP